jgi:hypothetical protein
MRVGIDVHTYPATCERAAKAFGMLLNFAFKFFDDGPPFLI